MNHRLKIVVLMGGPSEEHAISLKSGEGVAKALGLQHEVVPLVVPKELKSDVAASWTLKALAQLNADVAFIALHGSFGEDGIVQEVCESLSLPYTGSDSAASRLGIDKQLSRLRLLEAGIPVPQGSVVSVGGDYTHVADTIGYPLVVKPINQGSSVGISLVDDPRQLAGAIAFAGKFGRKVLVERYIRGRELTVGVVGNRVLPVVEIIPKRAFFDYTAKYTPGITLYEVPARLEKTVAEYLQELGQRSHRALGCRHLSRTDILYTPAGESVVLEVNTIPGFTPTSLLPKAAACIGLSYEQLCERLVKLALESGHKVMV